ncbi:hypothetical protein ABZY81_37565 [Streptomyces sp. NPDC006514]|uniref:hypothetical protein n=1 Tax=Streptomyces sp. NPDC006514 TaxID=3154308 RepID=UPI0033B09230
MLPARQPVVISMTACNNHPALDETGSSGNRAHLSWSTGPHTCPARLPRAPAPHACPARSHVPLIAGTATTTHVLDALSEKDLACPPDALAWRPGPFHCALAHPSVLFPTLIAA